MPGSECERPPGRGSVSDGLNIAMPCLAAGVAGYNHFHHAQQADFGASSNISEIIAEHRLCALPSDDVKRWLATAGVDLAALAQRWQTRPLDIPRIERVIFDGRGGFEFARYRQGVLDAGAIIFIVRNHIGDAIDLAAWGPPRPPALWMTRGALLGAENLFGFRMREALEVHPTPLQWLRAGCHGVVILDPAKAAPLLRRAEPLQVPSFADGRVLRKLLDVKPPRILVPASPDRGAAA